MLKPKYAKTPTAEQESQAMWSIYEIIHICTAVVYEVKSDPRSKFSNLSNWKWEAWKNQGFNGIRSQRVGS